MNVWKCQCAGCHFVQNDSLRTKVENLDLTTGEHCAKTYKKNNSNCRYTNCTDQSQRAKCILQFVKLSERYFHSSHAHMIGPSVNGAVQTTKHVVNQCLLHSTVYGATPKALDWLPDLEISL